ncbi:hypothetical protein NQ317_008884 [Molorchus minor]|uniref:Nodulin-like domain-containing protein n=1 Tax=Molorchus minor TaxID=1323400 RepID=A0ABQ9JNT2_9CUCU|nr:hypothetical protein NQ317_008884 [Molorchus minor]
MGIYGWRALKLNSDLCNALFKLTLLLRIINNLEILRIEVNSLVEGVMEKRSLYLLSQMVYYRQRHLVHLLAKAHLHFHLIQKILDTKFVENTVEASLSTISLDSYNQTNSHLEPTKLYGTSPGAKNDSTFTGDGRFHEFLFNVYNGAIFPKRSCGKGLSDTISGFIFSFYALVRYTFPDFWKITVGVYKELHSSPHFALLFEVLRHLEQAPFSTASYVFVVNAFPNNIGSVIGILETFVGLGMSTGPALGGSYIRSRRVQSSIFVLGIAMIVIVPLNMWLLPVVEDCENMTNKSTSMMKLIKVPAVVVTRGLVVCYLVGYCGIGDFRNFSSLSPDANFPGAS